MAGRRVRGRLISITDIDTGARSLSEIMVDVFRGRTSLFPSC